MMPMDNEMRDHTLFQAICRTNRLDGEDKPHGHIVDYKALFQQVQNSIAVYTSDEHFIPAGLNYLNAPEHVIGLAFPEGKLAVYSHWLPETELPLFKTTEYYDYTTERGRLEIENTPDSETAKAALALLNDKVMAKELRAPLPPQYLSAQKEALRKYWGWVLFFDTASLLIPKLKVGAP